MEIRRHDRYDYSPIVDRPDYSWPATAGWRCISG